MEALGKELYATVTSWPAVGGFITVHDLWAQLHSVMPGGEGIEPLMDALVPLVSQQSQLALHDLMSVVKAVAVYG